MDTILFLDLNRFAMLFMAPTRRSGLYNLRVRSERDGGNITAWAEKRCPSYGVVFGVGVVICDSLITLDTPPVEPGGVLIDYC